MSSKLATQDQVKTALGINNFSNMSTDKVKEFIKLIPSIDKDVVISIINQMPVYADSAKTIIIELNKMCDSALKSNESSQLEVIKSYQMVLSSLDKMISDGELDFEEKKYCTEKMVEIADKISKKDTENKEFTAGIVKDIRNGLLGAGAGLLVFGLISLFGGNNDNPPLSK